MRIYLYLFLISILPLQVTAQQYKAVSLSLAEGLSQSSVYDIAQDKYGFIWMATQDGLNRYDGKSFKVYREEPFDSTSISSTYINHLLCDSQGRLWIGTANDGLNLLMPGEETFHRFKSNSSGQFMSSNIITHVYEDGNKNIWVGTGNGLYRIVESPDHDISKIKFVRIPLTIAPGDTVSDKFINEITSDKYNQLWVGTYSGLFKIDISDLDIIQNDIVYVSLKGSSMTNDVIVALSVDTKGRIWAGGRGGIYIYDHTGKMMHAVDPSSAIQKGMKSNQVMELYSASNGEVWVGYTDEGVQVVNVTGSTDTLIFRNPDVTSELAVLSKGQSISFHEDQITRGLMWMGFNAGGAVRLIPLTKKFKTNHLIQPGIQSDFVVNILKDSQKNLWVGTSSGLYQFLESEKSPKGFFPSSILNKSRYDDHITGLTESRSGDILFGSANRLFRISENNGRKTITHIPLPDSAMVNRNNLRTIYKDPAGNIYLVLRYSVYIFDPENETLSLRIKITDPEKINDKGFFMSSLLVDQAGNFWLGTSAGIQFYSAGSSPNSLLSNPVYFQHQPDDTTSLRNQNILSIAQDKSGEVWIGTMNGLSKRVVRNGKVSFLNYSTRNGLNNNVIYSILTDYKTGYLWLSTNNGLIEFDPEGKVIANFDVHDGLQSNEFNSYAAFRADDGEMYFGGISGYTSFYPDQILTDKTPPVVSILGISLNGTKNIALAGNSDSKSIDLKYRDNSFTVNFAGLHYVDPQKVQFAYMLEGFQDNWIDAGTSSSVNFSQLPPGRYVFRVKAANSDGVFNEKGDTFIINISPPFYKTIWFYLILALLVAGMIYGLFKYRLSMKMQQVKEVEKIRRATAADFHDELGHKLTIISWFAEILKKKIGPEQADLRPHLDKIIEASGNLYHTMKDMLWAMDPDKDSVYDLYNQIKEFGLELFDNTGIEFEAGDIPGSLKDNIISPAHKRHVLLIFKEVMHNSLKHAHGSATSLDLVASNGHLKFRFRDNGSGFKLNGNGNGTGRGLENVKRRAKQINAVIDIHSENTGTVAELELEVAHLN